MPYSHEHACRINNPDKYDSFARKNGYLEKDGKKIDVIFGIKNGKSEIQALRYNKDVWTESEAKADCNLHNPISFEPASGTDMAPEDMKPEDMPKDKPMMPNMNENSLHKKYKIKKDREVRIFSNIEIRDNTENPDGFRIFGYAALFNSLSQDLGGYREIIDRGAFKKTLQEADIRALFNHDPNYVLGRNKAGTLKLEEDEIGLKIACAPPDTQWANDLLASMKRGDINQMSFGFQIIKEDWSQQNNEIVRSLKEVRLFDISCVTYPAYTETSAVVRSIDLSHLTKVFLKYEKGIELTEQDQEIARRTIQMLGEKTKTDNQNLNEIKIVVDNFNKQENDKINSLRRRLDLTEKI